MKVTRDCRLHYDNLEMLSKLTRLLWYCTECTNWQGYCTHTHTHTVLHVHLYSKLSKLHPQDLPIFLHVFTVKSCCTFHQYPRHSRLYTPVFLSAVSGGIRPPMLTLITLWTKLPVCHSHPTNHIPYTSKYLRCIIFVVIMDSWQSVKIKLTKF